MFLQDSFIPSFHASHLKAKPESEQTEGIVASIHHVFDSVFPNIGATSEISSEGYVPNSYTSLLDILPKIQDPNQWSDAVIRALFDTLAMPPDIYGQQYRSPEQNILRALEIEAQDPSKAESFKVLQTKLQSPAQELKNLKIHSYHRERIRKMIEELLV